MPIAVPSGKEILGCLFFVCVTALSVGLGIGWMIWR
jgi:hypothetical protein